MALGLRAWGRLPGFLEEWQKASVSQKTTADSAASKHSFFAAFHGVMLERNLDF